MVEGPWWGRDTVFVSYSHDDAEWMQAFQVMLRPVLADRGIRLWVDTDIRTGERWDPAIVDAISRSAVALLLVSPRWMDSEFIRDHELPALLHHGLVLAPVLVGSCFWKHRRQLAQVQWLHDPDRDGALNLVAEHPGERDRRIWQVSERLVALCPETVSRGVTVRDTPAPADVPRDRDDVEHFFVPAVESHPGRMSGVPALPLGYIQRDELTELVTLLAAPDVAAVGVTGDTEIGVHGQGGIGKSVLAAALAHDAGVRRRFPDGIFWVTIGQDGDVVAAQLDLLRRLDPEVATPATAEEIAQNVRSLMARRRLLLIVDDVWSAAAAQNMRLTGSRGRTLFTTRDAAVLAAVRAKPFSVGLLSLDGARELALAVLGGPGGPHERNADSGPSRTGPGLPVEADRAIEQVGRVALAVSLLAAAVRGGRTWTQVAHELETNSDVFGDHPYANTFKAMQIGTATLEPEDWDDLLSLAVFPADTRTPVRAIARYWWARQGYSVDRTRRLLGELAAARLLTYDVSGTDGGGVEFHDLQYEYLTLHAPALATLHGTLLHAYRGLLEDGQDWSRLPRSEPYIWPKLVFHLRGAGARRDLATTVTDPAFLVVRIATAGPVTIENELAAAAETLPDHPGIAWWRAWLPRHADILTLPDGDVASGPEHAVRALAPSLLAWLMHDPTRPVEIEPQRVRDMCERPYLAVAWGLESRPAAHLRTLPGHHGGITDLVWSPDAPRLAITSGAEIRVWDATTGQVVSVLQDSADSEMTVWSPGGTRLATTSRSGRREVRIWDALTGQVIAALPGSAGARLARWSPEGSRLATGDESAVQVWDVTSSQVVAVLQDTAGTDVVAWSSDGSRLATAGRHRNVRTWDPVGGQIVSALFGTVGTPMLAWSPVDAHLATASQHSQQEVRVWSPVNPKRPSFFRAPRGPAWSCGLLTAPVWSRSMSSARHEYGIRPPEVE